MHTSQVIDSKQLSDGALAVCVRCCDDPSTDSWFTLYDLVSLSDDEVQKQIEQHQQDTADRHEGMQRVAGLVTLAKTAPVKTLSATVSMEKI